MATLGYHEFRGRSYFPLLDGIRAVAVVAVVTFHVGAGHSDLLLGLQGARGVGWFFALSGFLVTTLALREEDRRGKLAVRPFLVRRSLRILPLYALALFLVVIADVVVFRDPGAMAGWSAYWPYYVAFLQDIPWNLRWPDAPFAGAWSLGVEEKFYLVWPILGFVLLGAERRLRVTVLLALALAATLLAWPGATVSRLGLPYLPIVLGCVVAMLLHHRGTYDRLSRLVRPASLGALATLVVAPMPEIVTGARGYNIVYALLTASAIGAFAVARRVPALGGDAVLWIGRRSYAIYLFHMLVVRVVDAAVERTPLDGEVAGAVVLLVTLAGTFLVADVLHRLVELPLIRLGRRWGGTGGPEASAEASGGGRGRRGRRGRMTEGDG